MYICGGYSAVKLITLAIALKKISD